MKLFTASIDHYLFDENLNITQVIGPNPDLIGKTLTEAFEYLPQDTRNRIKIHANTIINGNPHIFEYQSKEGFFVHHGFTILGKNNVKFGVTSVLDFTKFS